jgi:DNA-binding beta-propeller fold protein YncE
MTARISTPALLSVLSVIFLVSVVGCSNDDGSKNNQPGNNDTPDTSLEDAFAGDASTGDADDDDTTDEDAALPDAFDEDAGEGDAGELDADEDVGPLPFEPTYQVWTTDQGLSRILVWEPRPGDTFENVATIDYVALYPDDSEGPKPRTPHMIDFSPNRDYAFIAHTSSGHTTVIRTSDYEVVAVLATGPATHMTRVSPTGRIYVDVIGNADFPGRLLELEAEYATETFRIKADRELIFQDDPKFDAAIHPSHRPVCGVSTPDDRYQFITFGPGFAGAMLARIDNATFTVDEFYDPTVIRANCGSIVGPDGNFYFTGGAAGSGEHGVGVWYVLNGTTFEPIAHGEDGAVERSTHGTDAHGINFTADGSEIWIINRDSDNVAIFDAATYELKENVEGLFDGPDIADISADGRFFFVTLRGRNPRSGPHSIAGSTPGLAVVDIAEREVVTVLTGENDDEDQSDYHGLRVLVFPSAD